MVVSPSPAAKAASATTASWLASSTFFPSPVRKRHTPEENSAQLSCRSSSCRATVSYRTMGPATSWGKKEMYSPTMSRLRCTSPLPRATSTT